ncbi:MAG: Dam family site-specific DNA-(adenine-N6)-methyltransferase [Chloroflexota bacterium]
MTTPLVPPLKCQGIKTKLISEIQRLVSGYPYSRWIEPFCGSCVVPLNIQPKNALLSDTNIHIIQFYQDIQSNKLTASLVKEFLVDHGEYLRTRGEDYYYEIREHFNSNPNSYDFLFLNRSCFNGVMRFNRNGRFNVPFCRKINRFSPAYITKIINQIRTIATVIQSLDWEFRVAEFHTTLEKTGEGDFVYADPPYAGRHTDYFNSWSDEDEISLAAMLQRLPCRFILSTWHSNEFRHNPLVEKNWDSDEFHIFTRKHYYHVGSTEDLRHPMIEALITNFNPVFRKIVAIVPDQMALFEEPANYIA